MKSPVIASALAIIAGTSLSSCKTFPSGDMAPAVLTSPSDTSLEAVELAAKEILNLKTVQLGSRDFANSPAISVLPKRAVSPPGAPFNQQDFAMPTILLLMTDGKNCFLVQEDTRKWAHLKGIDCRSIG